MWDTTYVEYTSKYFWKKDLKNILDKIRFTFVSGTRTNPISQAYFVNKFSFHHTTRTCSRSLVGSQREVPSHLSMLVVHFPPPPIITQRKIRAPFSQPKKNAHKMIKMLYITSDWNHSNWAQTRLLSVIPLPNPEMRRALMDTVIRVNPQVSQTLQLTSTSAETIIF